MNWETPEQGWRRPLAAAFGFALIAVFVMGYALGVAVGVAFAALIALPPWRRLQRLLPLDLSFSVFLMFIAWAWLSTIWSPYDNSGQALRMATGAFLYPLFVYAVWSLRGKARRIVMLTALVSGSAMALPYLLEGFTGIISHFFASGADRDDYLRDATRGVSAIIMALPPLAVLWMKLQPGWRGRVAAGLLVVVAAIISWQFHLFAGLVALGAGGFFFALGYRWPRSTILMITLAYLTMLLLAPLLLPNLVAPLDGDNLPFSWAWRVKMWPYTGAQIGMHPFIGWGLDASRTFTHDVFKMHGYTLNYLSYHPHDFGLQVWLETGLVGALILGMAILLFGLRLAGISSLTHPQGAAIAGSAAVYLVFFSVTYGAWQEWLWASVAWVAALCILAGPEPRDRS